MGRFDHLLDHPRPSDEKHPPMPLQNRAAQFAPFDALTGFGGRIYEASRQTHPRIYITEEQKLEINRQLVRLKQYLELDSNFDSNTKFKDAQRRRPQITVTYFVPDLTKDGGSYETVTAPVYKILPYDERLILEDELTIAFDDILTLSCEFSEPAFEFPKSPEQ